MSYTGKRRCCPMDFTKLQHCADSSIIVWVPTAVIDDLELSVGDVVFITPRTELQGCYIVTADTADGCPVGEIVSGGFIIIDSEDGCDDDGCAALCPTDCTHCPEVVTIAVMMDIRPCMSTCPDCAPGPFSGSIQAVRSGDTCTYVPENSGVIIAPQTIDAQLCQQCKANCVPESPDPLIDTKSWVLNKPGLTVGNLSCGVIGFMDGKLYRGWSCAAGVTALNIQNQSYDSTDGSCTGEPIDCPSPACGSNEGFSCLFVKHSGGDGDCPMGSYSSIKPGEPPVPCRCIEAGIAFPGGTLTVS